MFKLPAFGRAQVPVQHQPDQRLKRVYLSIQPGHILVRTPLRVRKQDILQLLDKHHDWLQQQLEKAETRSTLQAVYYLGKNYPLIPYEPTAGRCAEAVLTPDALQLYLPAELQQPERVKDLVMRFLAAEARRVMHQRLLHWCGQMQISPAKVRYKWLKSRWGSCSARQNINLNIRAVQLPMACIDAILVHELAHLRHLNHGPDFWALVHTHIPDYPQCDAVIKQMGPEIL
ncbi:MAG: M48 family metallopeptidase [Candidatus Sericytochromatia bacterium]|nr:M48 family metallopeptidase [Candidatus Sericytochromatia bacterium]